MNKRRVAVRSGLHLLSGSALAIALGACASGSRQRFEQDLEKQTAGIFLDGDMDDQLRRSPGHRNVSREGIELTKRFEGFKSKLYNDAAGYCTIGYGHLIKKSACDGTEPRRFQGGMSHAEATEILLDDMQFAERAVSSLVRVALTDGQHAALCDFVFNVGSSNFSRSSLRQVVNRERMEQVPGEMRRWRYAGGKEWKGLISRREAELVMYFGSAPRMVPSPLAPIDVLTGKEVQVS